MLCRSRVVCVVALVATLFISSAKVVAQIFTDDLSSGTNWTIVQDSDTSAEFGFDYSTRGLPPAPGGSDTVGLKLEVNNSLPTGAVGIVVLNNNAAYTGQYTLRVDVWSNWAPDGGTTGSGTTEFTGATVGHNGSGVQPFGGAFLYTGDGDAAATDYRLYKEGEQLQSESGQYAAGDVDGSRDSSNPYYADAFPLVDIETAVPTQGSTGSVNPGAAGFQWMTLNFEVDTNAIGPSGNTSDAGTARISMRSDTSGNTIEIGTIDNSNGDTIIPTNLEGSIGLMMFDLFSSVTLNPEYSFGIFDNVQVLDGLVPLSSGGIDGDFNGNGFVEGDDFLVWQRDPGVGSLVDWQTNFGTGTPIQSGVTAVPEPASFALSLVGVAVVVIALRRS